MKRIHHVVDIDAPVSTVWSALTGVQGLTSWTMTATAPTTSTGAIISKACASSAPLAKVNRFKYLHSTCTRYPMPTIRESSCSKKAQSG